MRFPLVVLTTVAFSLGCSAATPGAHPHDMGAASHEQAAANERAAAAAHGAEYDPSADRRAERCAPGHAASASDVCWWSSSNTTEAHKIAADRHRKAAADHRAASQALRDAEANACVGLPPDDRDMSPFAHREDIVSVAPLQDPVAGSKTPMLRTAGAVVTFRAVHGLTAEWLQRLMDCHVARASALGHEMPEMPYCPLVPKGASTRVTPSGGAFAVAIRSDDPAAAAEILRRAQQLISR